MEHNKKIVEEKLADQIRKKTEISTSKINKRKK